MFAPWSPQPLRGFNECLVSPPPWPPHFRSPLGRHSRYAISMHFFIAPLLATRLARIQHFYFAFLDGPSHRIRSMHSCLFRPWSPQPRVFFVLHFFWFLHFSSSKTFACFQCIAYIHIHCVRSTDFLLPPWVATAIA